MALTRRTLLGRLLPLAAAVAAVVVLVLALQPRISQPSLDERTQDVAAQLRCPTCVAESAADSTSPVAESMRSEIRRQLAAGRSEDQVLAWFRSRYGDDIVLDPQRHGLGWVLWAAPPVAAVAVGTGLVVIWRRRGRESEPAGTAEAAYALTSARLAVVLTVAVAAAVAVPLLLQHGSHQAAATQSTAASPSASTAAPSAGTDPVALAFSQLRSGRPAVAERMVRPVAHRPGPDRPLALLVLGLAQRAEGEPDAVHTLRSFLARYPHHPAAAQVRRLLATS